MEDNAGNLSLTIYRLEACHAPKANEWLENLSRAFKKAELKVDCVIGDIRRIDYSFWEGAPFIIVGHKNILTTFLHKTHEQTPELVADHAYYWCLSDIHQDDLSDQALGLNDWRESILNWEQSNHNVVVSFLKGLVKHQPIVGLSAATHKLRQEIYRLAKGEHGPWTPTLILGESGVGKEMVANAIIQASSRRHCGFTALACAWLSETLLQDQLFGHKKGAFADAYEDRAGLLESNSNGAILFDDIDTAPPNVQGALLRIMSAPRGQSAHFSRLGETRERNTGVWLMFATNADIAGLIKEKKWRDDFIFRFEDRVVHVPPLRERLADIPALARHIWRQCHADVEGARVLPLKTIKWLCDQRLAFSGNVRAFRALLSLTASMAKQPVHNHQSIQTLLEAILSRGPDYHHWVGIIASPSFTGPIEHKNPCVLAVLALDKGFNCHGSNKNWTPPLWASKNSPLSELEAKALLMALEKDRPGIVKAFQLAIAKPKMSGNKPRPGARLSRILVYLNRYETLDKKNCTQLNDMSEAMATEDFRVLEDLGLIHKEKSKRKDIWRRQWPLMVEPAS